MLTATAPVPDTAPVASRLELVALSQLRPSPLNPRRKFDDLAELARNLAARGVIVPLLVRRIPGEPSEVPILEVVDGERRYRAALEARLATVPVIVRDLTDAEVLEIQIVSAIQRADLTPLEEARGYRNLIDSNPARYSAAYIGDRIGRSERYVVDRMRLLALIPDLQRLLEAERIGVAHAEILAKLKPEDQARAVAVGDPRTDRGLGGLWTAAGPTLDFDLDAGPDDDQIAADPYLGLKVVTTKELEAWIARHVRFDLAHAATTAPLEFSRVQQVVEAAQERPGRGRKIIHITHDHHLADEVKDPSARVYGPRSWKRADGTVASVYDYGTGKRLDAPTCEHAVSGLVVVGPEYGTAFDVCIARDKCRTHWGDEIRAKEKAAKEAEKTGGKKKTTERPVDDWEARQARAEEARVAERQVYATLHPLVEAKLKGAVPGTLNARAFAWLWSVIGQGRKAPSVKPAQFMQALVLGRLEAPDTHAWNPDQQIRRALALAEAFGVDGKALEKAARKHVAEAKKAEAKKTPAPASTKKGGRR